MSDELFPADWLIFRLAEDKMGRGALDDEAIAPPGVAGSKLAQAARTALGKGATVRIDPQANGLWLEGPTRAQLLAVAAAVAPLLGSVGLADMTRTYWWEPGELP